MQEVPFTGHIATADGLCVDPHKIQAIREIPKPADVATVQRLLGLSQVFALPVRYHKTFPRVNTERDRLGMGPAQQKAWETLKKAISSAPVLCCYNLQVDVTLQCDAS